MSTPSEAVIALGSNLGDREATLRSAVAALGELDEVSLVAASVIVESPALKPHGVDRVAPAYLNAVVIAETSLEPLALLGALNEIEARHGRVREEHWGDRTLDLDLVAFGDVMLDTERLTLPHPRAGQRAFVLAPWLQADPDARLTGHGPVDALLAAADDEVLSFEAAPLLPGRAGAARNPRRGEGAGA